jgi:hypothetical protein
MRLLFSRGPALGAAAALVSLTACAGGGSQSATGGAQSMLPQSHLSALGALRQPNAPLSLGSLAPVQRMENRSALRFVDPDAVKVQVDVAQYGVNSAPGEANAYAAGNKKNKKPFCQISPLTGVNAIETDASGNLWVPQVTESYVNEVVEYAPDCGKPGTVLSDPDGQPVDIAFAASGITYVSNILGPSSSTVGSISIYPKGATTPSGELTNSSVFYSLGVAVDSKGNVYQSFLGNSSGTAGGVLEFKGGKGAGKVLKGIKIDEPGTVFIDANDNLIVPDQGAPSLNTYKPPYSKLASSIPLQNQSIQCAVDKAEDNVACADRANEGVDVYAYPAGTYQYSFTNGLSSSLATIGIAQDPP